MRNCGNWRHNGEPDAVRGYDKGGGEHAEASSAYDHEV
jgi:hypothetical protein